MEEQLNVVVVAETDAVSQALAGVVPSGPWGIWFNHEDDPMRAIEVLVEGRADLCVVDLDRLDGQGLLFVTMIRESTDAPVLGATIDVEPEAAARALAAGASGLLSCDDDGPRLGRALRRAAAGELVLPDRDLPTIVDRLRSPADRLLVLTIREREILRCLAEGLSTGEVAATLGISSGTVQVHVKNVLTKLGLHSKVQAVRVALLAGVGAVSRSA